MLKVRPVPTQAACHILGDIGQERDLHGAQAALGAGSLGPRQVGVGAVDGRADYGAVDRGKLVALRTIRIRMRTGESRSRVIACTRVLQSAVVCSRLRGAIARGNLRAR